MQDEILSEEFRKESRAADKADKEAAELFEAMVKSEAWKVYEAMLLRKIEAQGTLVLEPARSVDGAIVCEYEKGTMRGLLIAKDLPHLTIQAAKQISDPDTGTDL